MISANGGLPAHRYTPQVTQRWPRGSEPASPRTEAEMFPSLVHLLLALGRPQPHIPQVALVQKILRTARPKGCARGRRSSQDTSY